MSKYPYADVDEYIAVFGGETRVKLEHLRNLIKDAAPLSEEKLSWGMPTYYQRGFLVEFAAYKKHIGFYTNPTTIEHFREELRPYKTNGKNTTQLPLDKELPDELITAMVKYRIEENMQKKEK
ncbi:MAG: iron chaperone [Bacillota bacterium]|jgi:uncharacterized protein YdhG (YjbR/CyaY superfamily)